MPIIAVGRHSRCSIPYGASSNAIYRDKHNDRRAS